MKKFSICVIVSLFVLLSGCKSLNLGAIAGGASAVSSAPAVKEAIETWIDGDEQALAALQPPALFFESGYNVLSERGADIPILELVGEFPDYVDRIVPNWIAMKAAMDEYEQRSGKPRPALVSQFILNGEAAYGEAKRAIEFSDKYQTACNTYQLLAPVAALVSPIPLPQKLPACNA